MQVLDDEFVPRKELFVHREAEMRELTATLAPVLNGFQAGNSFLYGPSGSGKTTVAKVALDRLQAQGVPVSTGYVNCWRNHSTFEVLRHAARSLANEVVSHANGSADLVQGLDRTLDNPAILILDEADQLDCSEVLYHFHSISNLSLIFIANREIDLLAGLQERVDSRVRAGRRVRFTRYSDEEVTDILRKRATHALQGDAVPSDILAEIAVRADGDARLAINILRETVQAAATAGLHNVTLAHVREATPRAEEHVHQKNLSKLNSHQRVICEVLDEHGPCNQGEMYDHYESTHPDPITLRALREHHLPKLEHYNLLSVSRVGRGKRYDIQSPHE